MLQEKPVRLLILGDTNSALAALVDKRLRIPVYHMEAGNRCYDDRVPEEINRRVVDHCSDILLPYTERSRAKGQMKEEMTCKLATIFTRHFPYQWFEGQYPYELAHPLFVPVALRISNFDAAVSCCNIGN
ncbi:UDP-N-acetylglucosamine 2-epimerase [Desulfosporosinus sp. BICA1-9]|uniref:UDP-N-acetylglucosamine 2-epimerase n=1 Tax=Desulfosporosinus sp. BICA1-9 TaxID=1531958 RepID=UPI000B27115C|nr:UDP-N-acetylglucosamine 2-epimerase [Desulfosporosinus sp. BICA1-9]